MINQNNISGIGVGLRSEHFSVFLSQQASVDWIEILADHFIFSRGLLEKKLRAITESYPSVLHCVGLSIGGTDPFDEPYLLELKRLSELIKTPWISDHLCWSTLHGKHSHDLLPLPFTKQVIDHTVSRIHYLQEFFNKLLLIENVSRYVTPPGDYSEAEMMNEIAKQTGCGILLDVNNVYVTAHNEDLDPKAFLDKIDVQHVKQAHLAGYTETPTKLIDTHGEKIHEPVWQLYDYFLKRFGPVPTCIEWDQDVPEWALIAEEISRAKAAQDRYIDRQPKAGKIKETQADFHVPHEKQTLSSLDRHDHKKHGLAMTEVRNEASLKNFQENFWGELRSKTPGPIDIHRNNIQAQRLNSLQKTFPACLNFLNESRFNFLALSFFDAAPSHSPNIAASGEHFGNFLRKHSTHPEIPELADLADYEWAWHQVFHGKNHGTLDLSVLQNIHAESKITLTPNTILLSLDYPAHSLWQEQQPEYHKLPQEIHSGIYCYALQQRCDRIMTHELTAPEFQALAALHQEKILNDWLLLCETIENFNAECIAKLVGCGLISINSSS